MAKFIYKVKGSSETPSRILARARGFNIIVDEPASLGGDDLGPNPLEYVLAGLAGCINVIGHGAADEMGFEIKHLDIEVRGTMERSEGARTGFTEIEARIDVDSDAGQESLDKWAERLEGECPVADNLNNHTPVRVRVTASAPRMVGADI